MPPAPATPSSSPAPTPSAGARSHSLLLVDTAAVAPSLTRLPRFRTVGMRGCHLSGFDFDHHRVPANSLIGAPGTAVETALRSFQVTRCVTAGLGIGAVDAVLAAVLGFAQQRRLYGGTVAQIPHARTVMADAFADLLVADAFATSAARLLHTAPRHGSRYAASVKYLVPMLLEDAARSLAVVLGARSYLRRGEYAIVGKHLRDLPVLSIGHAGGTACLLTVLPQLTLLGRLGEGTDTVPANTFHTTPLPELDVSDLCLLGRGHDPLIGTLAAQLADLLPTADPPTRALANRLRDDLRALLDDARSLPADGCGVDAAPAAFRLAERYTLLAAAACCIGVWQAGRLPTTAPDSTWLRALLGGLAAGSAARPPPTPTVTRLSSASSPPERPPDSTSASTPTPSTDPTTSSAKPEGTHHGNHRPHLRHSGRLADQPHRRLPQHRARRDRDRRGDRRLRPGLGIRAQPLRRPGIRTRNRRRTHHRLGLPDHRRHRQASHRGAEGRIMTEIAVVGIDCRFPGAATADALWQLLMNRDVAASVVPAARWDIDRFHSDQPRPGTMNTRHAHFIDDADIFDHEFFGISPVEAAALDPQQRLVLQSAWRAIEDAALDPRSLAGTDTGVFVGMMSSEWGALNMLDYPGLTPQRGIGGGHSMVANRVSYHLNLTGPSVTVDTACSSSLTAVHLACQALTCGDSDLVVAAGVNLMLTPALSIFYTQAGLSAPDGRCKPFSADADGIGRGEGVGTVVLRRLTDAVADRQPVYAIIAGSATNQDGKSNGITAPNRWSQSKVMLRALDRADAAARDVTFVEAHGTGTMLGDMIEANALGDLHRTGRDRPCLLGSIKGNIGHPEGAAGIAALIKSSLALAHGVLPPTVAAAGPNPALRLEQQGLQLATTPVPLGEKQVLAGVSSYGLGGSNVHVMLASPPAPSDAESTRTG